MKCCTTWLGTFQSKFGECPPFFQFSPKVTICFKVIYFLTTRSHWVQLSNWSIYAIVHSYISSSLSFLVTQEFPVIVDSYWFNHMYNTMVSSSPRPIVTRLDNNTFPTGLSWLAPRENFITSLLDDVLKMWSQRTLQWGWRVFLLIERNILLESFRHCSINVRLWFHFRWRRKPSLRQKERPLSQRGHFPSRVYSRTT